MAPSLKKLTFVFVLTTLASLALIAWAGPAEETQQVAEPQTTTEVQPFPEVEPAGTYNHARRSESRKQTCEVVNGVSAYLGCRVTEGGKSTVYYNCTNHKPPCMDEKDCNDCNVPDDDN